MGLFDWLSGRSPKKIGGSTSSSQPVAIEKCPFCRGKLAYAGITQGDMAVFNCPSCDTKKGTKAAIGLKKSDGDWK